MAVGAGVTNSGFNLMGHHPSGMTAAAAASSSSNNYNMGGANFCGLGAVGNLANLGYLNKNGATINANNNNISAYATNASDLLKGFKSS